MCHSRSLETAPIDRPHTSSYSSSIVSFNYGRVLYHFRNKARYWSKNANFSYAVVFNLHDPLEPLRIFVQNFNSNCPSPWATGWCKNIAGKFKSLPKVQQRHITLHYITDGRQTTDGRLFLLVSYLLHILQVSVSTEWLLFVTKFLMLGHADF